MTLPRKPFFIITLAGGLGLSGCVGSTFLDESKEKKLREIPTLNSVPNRPALAPEKFSAADVQKMKETQDLTFKKNDELRRKYSVEKGASTQTRMKCDSI